MATCFVIQPFDGGKFDKRFDDCFAPAIRDAGLEPYRVDGDHTADVLIASIEDGISKAAVCLAEISNDNANVWYELGYAMALGKQVVMICEKGRPAFPFDIRHRKVIEYRSESSSDFDELRKQISSTISARLSNAEMLKQAAESDLLTEQQGLSHPEVVLVAAIAAEAEQPTASAALRSVKSSAEQQAVTPVGIQLALRRLQLKKFISLGEDDGEWGPYHTVGLTDVAWAWIDANDGLFALTKPARGQSPRRRTVEPLGNFADDDIPF